MKSTLGLTGLTMNAMALIAPGAFLWLTFFMQSNYGAPMAGSGMWMGIVGALLLCFATAISYAELSKLYPGAGSSYFFAEQAFLSKTHAYRFARLSKYIVGWASHLYYWVYPGVMVGTTAVLAGYMLGNLWPDTFNVSTNSPTFMIGFCVVFAFGVAYIAYRGVVGATGVNIAINVIQISALLIFSVIAFGYRVTHGEGAEGFQLDPDGMPTAYAIKFKVDQFDANNNPVQKDKDGNPAKDKDGKVLDKDGKPIDSPTTLPVDKDGKPIQLAKDGSVPKESVALLTEDEGGNTFKDADGNWIPVMVKNEKTGKMEPKPFVLHYADDKGKSLAITEEPVDASDSSKGTQPTRQFFENSASVVQPHAFSFVIIQACIAILILVGFESVTSMGEEAKNAKRDIPRAVLLSLFIQGVICYLIEYFAANYALNPGYRMTDAAKSSAPIGDMMKIVGAWLFGSPSAGWWFMFIQAITVLLALVGTTLSCINTGARVTYAMGRDDEVPSHFGMLHGKNLTPHRAIWTLATISVVVGIFACSMYLCSPTASDPSAALTDAQKASFWYPAWMLPSAEWVTKLPNSLLIVTLVSNFGTFMLYMLTCIVAIVAFREHHTFNTFKHTFIPVFGLLANLLCMGFYIVGPFMVAGMTKAEPFAALGFAALWGIYGWFYFSSASKKKGRTAFLTPEHKAAAMAAPPI